MIWLSSGGTSWQHSKYVGMKGGTPVPPDPWNKSMVGYSFWYNSDVLPTTISDSRVGGYRLNDVIKYGSNWLSTFKGKFERINIKGQGMIRLDLDIMTKPYYYEQYNGQKLLGVVDGEYSNGLTEGRFPYNDKFDEVCCYNILYQTSTIINDFSNGRWNELVVSEDEINVGIDDYWRQFMLKEDYVNDSWTGSVGYNTRLHIGEGKENIGFMRNGNAELLGYDSGGIERWNGGLRPYEVKSIKDSHGDDSQINRWVTMANVYCYNNLIGKYSENYGVSDVVMFRTNYINRDFSDVTKIIGSQDCNKWWYSWQESKKISGYRNFMNNMTRVKFGWNFYKGAIDI